RLERKQRLFQAEQQRAAELAIINSVQQGLASKLDLHAIYELVGEKIREIFDAQAIFISTLDRAARMNHSQYAVERGVPYDLGRYPVRPKLLAYLDRTHQPLVIGPEQAATEFDIPIAPGTDESKSLLFVPLIVADQVT